MGGLLWPDRKNRVREAYYEKIAKTPEQQEVHEIQEAMESLLEGVEAVEARWQAEARIPEVSSAPSTTPEPTGDAAGPNVSAVARFARRAGPLPEVASTATSATGMAWADDSTELPTSGTPATSTSEPSISSTVWQETPLGLLEHNLSPTTVDPNGQLKPGLPLRVQSSLHALATGRSEPVAAVIQAIAEFYVEQEDERAEMPMVDALTHYVENQLV